MTETFPLMLKEFEALIDNTPEASTVKNQLEKLSASAESSNELNIRQKEAIMARCKNYINGEYVTTIKALR